MEIKHVSNNVCEVRNKQKMTQEGLAEKINVSRQTIISIEKGNYTPSVLLALKISKTLNVNVEGIFSIK